MITLYSIHCKICKKQTPHNIFKTHIRKGGKLICLICSTQKKQYINFNLLKEMEIER